MNRQHTAELFKMLVSVYPQFEVDQYKIDLWTRLMKDQDPKKVMRRAEMYVRENKFPPTIADLSEKIDETHNSDFLEKVKQWKAEASEKH